MVLKIASEETDRLAHELASLTGESVPAAVEVAIRERLKRVQSERKSDMAERLLAIGRESAARFKEPYRSVDHGDLLYDDLGLPK